ncbi:MAG: hypothetical protein L6420_09760 [Elusimicrobia bacterium]|nr:hypothetical protein [Elusimicrobiota bacterium]
MNNRLREILKQNAEFEEQVPYNFCDRWCERCAFEKKSRCKLYKDEFEQKITCIALGKEPDDPEITAEIMQEQYRKIDEAIEKLEEETELDLDDMDNTDFEKIKNHIKSIQNHPLLKIADEYCEKAASFLKSALYGKKAINRELAYQFDTVAWHHILLPAKLNRALAGFHEPATDGDMALYDAVAQLEISKKAIEESLAALSEIGKTSADLGPNISHLTVLLKEIKKKIEKFEENI